jgi:RNA polymerase sigma factor (sigma-70 family)
MFLRAAHSTTDMTAERFLSGLHVLDAALAMGCLERLPAAWELLFAARAGRSDRLLIDALRWHAVRFFPQNQAAQEEQVTDFWGSLLAPDREEGIPLLEKYDGQRPLVPWLIHCFRNAVITWKRKQKHLDPLPDLDVRDAHSETDADSRWSQTFADAARDWLAHLKEEELALLGLRWRYRLSQREVAKVFGIHEGNIAKRIDKLRARCLEQIGRDMEANGFLGEDLQGFILREMDSLLLEEPQLTAESLARLLRKLGMSLPIGEGSA